MHNKLFAVGGRSEKIFIFSEKKFTMFYRDGSACLRSVECYDPHTNKWSSVANMCRRRGGVAVGVLNGFLYAVGRSIKVKMWTEVSLK